MRQYIGRRLILIIPTVVIVITIVFSLVRLLPGDAVDQMVEQYLYAQDREAMKQALGLDKPFHQQFLEWTGNLLRGNLGSSLWSRKPALYELGYRLPVSVELGLLAIAFAIIVGLPIGVLAAIRQDTITDYFFRSLAIMFIAIPNFWLGTLLIVFPSLWWSWSPPIRFIPFAEDPIANLGQFLLPAVVLGARPMGSIMRMTRAMMLEVLRQDYIRTAWAKGLREGAVIYRHAIKNAMIPVITVIGLQLHFLVGGSVIVETVFGLPGLGRYIIQVVTLRDYPMVQALNIFFATFILLNNFVVDLTYGYLDPRIRFR